jgi:hypothetical protein
MQSVRWKFYDPALLYLFPATYIAHLVEEWLASAPIRLWAIEADRPLAAIPFMSANATGLLLMLAGIHLVRRGARFRWIVPALATAVLLNTAGHLAGSFAAGGYSAGLITAVVLWVPLGMLTLLRAWDQATPRTLVGGVAVGVVVEIVVVFAIRLGA